MIRRRHQAGGIGGAVWWWVVVLATLLLGGAPRVRAADGNRNACGCYANDVGTCYCDRKAKCGCPGQCEPKGCEEQRQRRLDKEIQAETIRAEQAQRLSHNADGDERIAPTPAREKTPASRARTRAPRLSAQQQRQLARLLELYVAEDPARRTMRTDEVVKTLDASPSNATPR